MELLLRPFCPLCSPAKVSYPVSWPIPPGGSRITPADTEDGTSPVGLCHVTGIEGNGKNTNTLQSHTKTSSIQRPPLSLPLRQSQPHNKVRDNYLQGNQYFQPVCHITKSPRVEASSLGVLSWGSYPSYIIHVSTNTQQQQPL